MNSSSLGNTHQFGFRHKHWHTGTPHALKTFSIPALIVWHSYYFSRKAARILWIKASTSINIKIETTQCQVDRKSRETLYLHLTNTRKCACVSVPVSACLSPPTKHLMSVDFHKNEIKPIKSVAFRYVVRLQFRIHLVSSRNAKANAIFRR